LLSYRHSFHAGNLADLLKHSVLIAVLQAALKKTAPLLYLDTHAGAGFYELDTADATAEHRAGIGALLASPSAAPPECIAHYLAGIVPAPRGSTRVRYPGSAAIAAGLLRDDDRLILAERHPADHAALDHALGYDPRVRIEFGDGYALLKSALPPVQRRGVVLIDPAYELTSEPVHLIDGLRTALNRFRHGVYLVWYPLRGKHDMADMQRHFLRLQPPKTLRIELHPGAPDHAGAIASGLWLINPPYQAIAPLEQLLRYLHQNVVTGGRVVCDWLVDE
jgi:23S rRNA (adenine2030-N6)-methyltransferase